MEHLNKFNQYIIESSDYSDEISILKKADDILEKYKTSGIFKEAITKLNDDGMDYYGWTDLKLLSYYLEKKGQLWITEGLSAKEFADKYNKDYNFIVYKNGDPISGWEYLSDAIIDGMMDYLKVDVDEFDYRDYVDLELGKYNISIDDEYIDIDIDDLNSAISEISNEYLSDKFEIRFVN